MLEAYTDKYFEIITERYIPGILGTKRNVKAVGMRSDSVVGDYRNARYKIQLVQSHLLFALYYFSTLYYPHTAGTIVMNDNEQRARVKNLFESYGVNRNNNMPTTTTEITNTNLDFDKIIELQNELYGQ